MALRNCVRCSEPYSDTLNTCPHCGYIPRVFVCPECGGIHGAEDTICRTCGYQLEPGRGIPANAEQIHGAVEKAAAALARTQNLRQAERNVYFLEILSQEPGADVLMAQARELQWNLQRQQECEELYEKLAAAQPTGRESLERAVAAGESLGDFRDAREITARLRGQLMDVCYREAHGAMNAAKTAAEYQAAANAFAALGEYMDAPQLAAQCSGKSAAFTAKAKKKTTGIVVGIVAAVVVIALVVSSILFFIPNYFYNSGAKLYESGSYAQAAEAYDKAGDFKDAPEQAVEARKAQAFTDGEAAFAAGNFLEARDFFLEAEDYPNAADRAEECIPADYHAQGCALLEQGQFQEAIEVFSKAGDYADTAEKTKDAWYGLADIYEQKGELVLAAETFSSVAGHKDAADRAALIAHGLLDKGEYAKAAKAFASIATEDGAHYSQYCKGLDAFEKGDYATAGAAFREAGEVEDSQKRFTESVYLQGLELLAREDFKGAQVCFDTVRGYEDSAGLYTVCIAEVALADGWLNTAIELYKKVPEGLTVEGFDIPGRIALVNGASRFAAVCGKWTVTKNYIESRCHYRFGSRWWNWYHDSPLSGQTLTVKCYLNDDGTVKMAGEVVFYRFTSYDYYGNCYATTTTKTFTQNNLKNIPYKIDVDYITSLTWSNGFKLKYSYRDEGNADYYYTYNSDVTYGSRTTVY